MLVYYVSIPFYNHEIYKSAGNCPDDKHRAFYVPHFEKNGNTFSGEKAIKAGPYKVIVREALVGKKSKDGIDNYLFDAEGNDYSLVEAIEKFGKDKTMPFHRPMGRLKGKRL